MTSFPGDENVNYFLLRATSPTCLTAAFDVEIESKCHHPPNTPHNHSLKSDSHIFLSMQGASEMRIGNINYYLSGNLLLPLVRWELTFNQWSVCAGVNKTCIWALCFSMSHYMNATPRTQRQCGYKSLGSHLELCLSPPRSCFLSCEWTQRLWSQMAQHTDSVTDVHFNKHIMRMRWDIMCHPTANDYCSKILSWPFQKWKKGRAKISV